MKKTKKWQPSESDLDWGRWLLSRLKTESVWACSSGMYMVDKNKKTLVRAIRGPGEYEETHARNKIAFGKLGYKVSNAKGV